MADLSNPSVPDILALWAGMSKPGPEGVVLRDNEVGKGKIGRRSLSLVLRPA